MSQARGSGAKNETAEGSLRLSAFLAFPSPQSIFGALVTPGEARGRLGGPATRQGTVCAEGLQLCVHLCGRRCRERVTYSGTHA